MGPGAGGYLFAPEPTGANPDNELSRLLKELDVVGGLGWFRRGGSFGGIGGDGPGENLDFLLGVGEAVAAGLDQAHAFLVAVEEFLKREFGVFHVGDDLLEAGEEVFEFFRRIAGIGVGGKEAAGDHAESILP